MSGLNLNFLDEDERRDPCANVLRTATFSACILVAAALALWVLQSFWALSIEQQSLRRAEERTAELAPNLAVATEVAEENERLREMRIELVSFSNAQIRLSQRLEAFAVLIPATVQLTDLKFVGEFVGTGKDESVPARKFTVAASGRTASEGAERRVEKMIDKFASFGGEDEFGTVTPSGVRVDPLHAEDRLFDVMFAFEPRAYRLDKTASAKKGGSK